MSVLQYCLCAESGWLPKLEKRKVAMPRAFTVGFRKFEELSFTSCGFARFNSHSFGQLLA